MFFGRDSGLRPREAPTNMLVAMGLAAALCIGIGVAPGILYSLLPYAARFSPYTPHHVVSTLGLLAFTALGFFALLKQLDPKPVISLDTDWFYRKGARLFMRWLARPLTVLDDRVIGQAYELVVRGPVLGVARLLERIDSKVVDASVDRVGSGTLAWSTVLRKVQSGKVHHYALAIAVGTLALLVSEWLLR